MGRGPKPAKSKEAKPPIARKSPKNEDSRGRDLEKRLAEALQREEQALRREAEAQEQQAATAEILRVISRSPADLQSVFDAMVDSAMRLFRAWSGNVCRFDGELVHLVATRGGPGEAGPSIRGRFPTRPTAGLTVGRCILDRAVIQIDDVETEVGLVEATREMARARGWRSALAVPMLRDGEPVGAIMVTRKAPGGFEAGSVELLQTFADQAVIAIENVRLFTETNEALEQQTATAEILGVISRSPTDVQPVFDSVVANAVRLCRGNLGVIYRYDGELMHLVTHHNVAADALEYLRKQYPRPATGKESLSKAIREGRIVQIEDFETDPDVTEEMRIGARLRGSRSNISVPLLRDGSCVGLIVIGKPAPGYFPNRQVELLKTFADQAVIAIENVRLFTELQASNRELTTALDTQTATSEILSVISSSPTDLQPVFDAIAANALRLCAAPGSGVYRVDGELIHVVALRNIDPGGVEAVRQAYPMPPTRGGATGRAILTRDVAYIRDVREDPEYQLHGTAAAVGLRSILSVPMLRGQNAIGAITVNAADAGAFSDNHMKLLQTFADQAVVAIENVRLFKEVEARTDALTRSVEQLTALGEVGQVISSTLDLQTVLSTIVARATQLAGADAGVIYEYDAERGVFEPRATEHLEPEIVEVLVTAPVRKGEGATGQLAISPEAVQLPDIHIDSLPSLHHARGAFVRAGYRALLAVPLLREDHLIGSLTVVRKMPGEFPRETVELLQTFATQSALAVQNARLFREIEDKSRQLEVASQHKSEFLANMSHELRTPLNAIIGFSEVLSEKMFGELNEKQEEYSTDIHASGQHLLSLINDILDLSKIEAGRMELELTDFHLPTALDSALTLVRERAGRRGIALHLSVDERLGQMRADERKVRQVVLNLLSNAIKFTPEGGRIEVGAVPKDRLVEISISDTGVGIAREDQEAVFEEFRQVGTADKKVEGTGLGLTLCRKFVELHGGRIWVKSQVGVGSTFTFTIPVRVRNEANAE